MRKKQSRNHYSFNLHFLTTKAFLVIMICLFLFLSLFVPYLQKIKHTEQLVAKTETATISVLRATEIRYQAVYSAIANFSNLYYLSEKTSWIGDAKFLESSFPEIEYLAWIDLNFFIRDIFPIEGNETLLNQNANSVQVGTSSISQWFSVFDGKAFQGFVLSSINLAKLIQPLEGTYLEGFMIQVKKNNEVIHNSSNWEEPNIQLMATQTLSLPKFADISFACAPAQASIQTIQTIFYIEIVVALMLSLLACLNVFFAQKFYSLSKMNESRYRNLLDDANLLAIILNTKGNVTYCNDFFLTATGYKREEIIGTDFFQRFSASDTRQEDQRFLNSVVKGQIPNQTEVSLITKSGETRWIHFNNTLQRNVKGNIIGFSALGEDITEQKKSAESFSKQYELLKTLFYIDQAITARDPISKTLSYILDQVNLQLGANASSVLLFNTTDQSLEYAEGKGFKFLEIQQSSIPLGVGLAGKAALIKTASSISNLQDSKTGYSRKEMAMAEGFNWYHVEPLLVKDKTNGVLEVFFKENTKPDDTWYSLIKAIAQQTAIAIDNSTLFTDLERSNQKLVMSYESTIEGWSRALDLRDKDTENHSLRVTEMTMRLCGLSGMSNNELINVRRGALLHDIGKMGISDNILYKKEKLSDSDWEAIRKHPQYAYELLYPIEYLRPAVDIPYCHHEKWDGSGYPRGLKEREIPLAARLFAVVDVWDALLSDRPYRKGWPKEKVLEEIKRLSGSHFDPEAVKLFINVIEEKDSQSFQST